MFAAGSAQEESTTSSMTPSKGSLAVVFSLVPMYTGILRVWNAGKHNENVLS
jgi:hypothetical protein